LDDVDMLGTWVFAPRSVDDVEEDEDDDVDDAGDVDRPDSFTDRAMTSWAVAGAVVNEMPPTEATATAPVPTTRATPENMATTRFGFTSLTVNS
jgi:hypothetical protein